MTLSNLNRFLKLLHCWKAYEVCYKIHIILPTSPYHVATLPWKIENLYFPRYLDVMEENANFDIFDI